MFIIFQIRLKGFNTKGKLQTLIKKNNDYHVIDIGLWNKYHKLLVWVPTIYNMLRALNILNEVKNM